MKPLRSVLFIVFGMFLSLNISAQTRQLRKTDSVFRILKKRITAKDAIGIADLGNTYFKRDSFRDFLFREIFPLGAIKKDSLISFVNDRIATYQIDYASASQLLSISLGDGDKLDYFELKPYKKPPAYKPQPVPSNNALLTATDKTVDTIVRAYIQKTNNVGITVGLIKDGKTTTYNYGETARGNNQLPNSSTIYEIGSITKTFTATLLAWYVNEGKLNLNDPITKYLPDSLATNTELKKIRLVNLSNHTSGLPRLPTNFTMQLPYDRLNPYKNYGRQQLYTYLKTCTLNSQPGQKYDYSNLAVALLGNILERVSGKPFEQMVNEIICQPLGMNTTMQHLYPLLQTRLATGYNEDGKQTPAWDFDVLAAHGALKSTMDDLLLFTKANMHPGTDKLGNALQLTHRITFSGSIKLGLGWHIIVIDGVSYYYHNGGTYGSSSFLAYNTDKNLAVIVLSNAAESTDIVGDDILKKLQ